MGLGHGQLDADELVRIDVPRPKDHNLRIPSGNERGANESWRPGGKLPNGNSEAVIDLGNAPPSAWTSTLINF
ncbi:MAG: hypothetical protein HQK50_03565 [Oligoflexia bacterium]|nr:hypothetical protein [Oligoflexia bacterium]MBF0364621.1 hypothetical protein [Oligoflexia bacterium]